MVLTVGSGLEIQFQIVVDESAKEWTRICGQTLTRVATLTNSHPLLTGPLKLSVYIVDRLPQVT